MEIQILLSWISYILNVLQPLLMKHTHQHTLFNNRLKFWCHMPTITALGPLYFLLHSDSYTAVSMRNFSWGSEAYSNALHTRSCFVFRRERPGKVLLTHSIVNNTNMTCWCPLCATVSAQQLLHLEGLGQRQPAAEAEFNSENTVVYFQSIHHAHSSCCHKYSLQHQMCINLLLKIAIAVLGKNWAFLKCATDYLLWKTDFRMSRVLKKWWKLESGTD